MQAAVVKPGFHIIVRIADDARIAYICEQRSLRRDGNCLVQFANDQFSSFIYLQLLYIQILKYLTIHQ